MDNNYPRLFMQGNQSRLGTSELRLSSVQCNTEESKGLLKAAVSLFCEVGERGGYPLKDCAPSVSMLKMISPLIRMGLYWSCRIESIMVSPCCWQLLRSMLERMQMHEVVCKKMLVILGSTDIDAEQRVLRPDDANEERMYPPRSSHYAFPVKDEDIPDSRMRRCLVELTEPPAKPQIEAISECVRPWFRLLEAAAYALPVESPIFAETQAGGVTVFDEMTVEIVVDRFVASEEAWNVLINLLAANNTKGYNIASIVIH